MLLTISSKQKVYVPEVAGEVKWTTERRGSAGKLTFEVLKEGLDFAEGDVVRFGDVFYGYVFSKSRTDSDLISVTAYDQLRYLKNKDVRKFENMTAGEIISQLGRELKLPVGNICDTKWRIASKVERNISFLEMMQNALDDTLTNTGELYVLYDENGKLTLKHLADMAVPEVIWANNVQSFNYTSSIDSDVYTKVKLLQESTGEPFEAYDQKLMNDWGLLQYYDTVKDGENGKAKAEALLKLYRHKKRSLSLEGCKGDAHVRGGSLVAVKLGLGDMNLQNFMLVEKAVHTFKADEHTMDLVLAGGEFSA